MKKQKRTTIKKNAIERNAISKVNRILEKKGLRLCRYSGKLLELNSDNFSVNNADRSGFQSVSKLGAKLYRDGLLEVKETDRPYRQYEGSKRVTTA